LQRTGIVLRRRCLSKRNSFSAFRAVNDEIPLAWFCLHCSPPAPGGFQRFLEGESRSRVPARDLVLHTAAPGVSSRFRNSSARFTFWRRIDPSLQTCPHPRLRSGPHLSQPQTIGRFAGLIRLRFNGRMPERTRRRSADRAVPPKFAFCCLLVRGPNRRDTSRRRTGIQPVLGLEANAQGVPHCRVHHAV
jgi:hypothetical protein